MDKATLRSKLSGARKSIIMWFSAIGGGSLSFAQQIADYIQQNAPALAAYVDASTLKYLALGSFAIIAIARATRKNAPLEDKTASKTPVDSPE